jgi:hypothetical protein
MQWIALSLLLFFSSEPTAVARFNLPELPKQSQALYEMNSSSYALRAASQDEGASFQLTIGINKRRLRSFIESPRGHHREKAQEILHKVQAGFARMNESESVTISVEKVFSTIGEVVVRIETRNASQAQELKKAILAALRANPDVLFAGEPVQVRIDP